MTLGLFLLGVSLCGVSAQFAMEKMRDYTDHPCIRPCRDGAPARRCVYDWTVEMYYSMSKACFNCPFNVTDCFRPDCVPAGGTARVIYTANRMMPGPGIQVCEGDELVVNVHNAMVSAEGLTIHWHGHQQNGSQLMDGAHLVTQCPIPQMATFQYRFKANDPGTLWWHSHSGFQSSDGLSGPLIIRRPPSRDPHNALYDYDLPEHVLLVADWYTEVKASRFAQRHHGNRPSSPMSLLINGKGAFVPHHHPENNTAYYTPYAEFKVDAHKRYRFRIINAVFTVCPIQFSIDHHRLKVIASDRDDFEPTTVDSIKLYSGERYDFVLQTFNDSTEEGSRNYWIRVRGLSACENILVHQVAVLRYKGTPLQDMPQLNTRYADSVRTGLMLNPWAVKDSDQVVPLESLDSMAPNARDEDDDNLKEVPDKKFYVAMDSNKIDNFHYHKPELYPFSGVPSEQQRQSAQLNNISYVSPPVPPLTQFFDLHEEEQFCNKETVQVRCGEQYCECTHRLKVAVRDVVEMVIVDVGQNSDIEHPMHLHGYHFRVISMEKLNGSTTLEEVQTMDRKGLIKRKLDRSVLKDTVIVPNGGYTVIRFKAFNRGVWLFHCHIDNHVIAGMSLLVQVGEAKDFPPRPPDFPTCGNWRPSPHSSSSSSSSNSSSNDNNNNNNNNNNQGCTGGAASVSQLSGVFMLLWVMVASCGRWGMEE